MTTFSEVVSIDQALQHEAAWRGLAARAEANPFGEVEFVGPALRHFGGARVGLIWESAQRAELIAVAALSPPPLGFGFVRVWRHEQAALAAVLLDRSCVEAGIEGLKAAARAEFRFAAGLIAPRVAAESALASAVSTSSQVFHPIRRAALDLRSSEAPNGKRRKEWKRLERRLAERGRLESLIARDLPSFERFLALEAKGWKGRAGTALAQTPQRLAFAREMATGFASSGRLAMHELKLDGITIAAGIVLRSARRAFFWKIAFDEQFAAYSPGVLLTRAIAQHSAESGEVDLIDSCAAPDHPMIEHVWPGRLDFFDHAFRLKGSIAYQPWLAIEQAAPEMRERAKRVLLPLLRRKRS